jgi:hypothetical protein
VTQNNGRDCVGQAIDSRKTVLVALSDVEIITKNAANRRCRKLGRIAANLDDSQALDDKTFVERAFGTGLDTAEACAVFIYCLERALWLFREAVEQ